MQTAKWSVLCLVVLCMGCGGGESGPTRYRVSGKVSFDGKPVPAGEVYFETANGPAGSAQITNGSYDTGSGKGIVGGPHSVVIQGFDGNGANPGEMGQPLFNPYREEVDFGTENSTHDFEIPASAAEGLIISNDPA